MAVGVQTSNRVIVSAGSWAFRIAALEAWFASIWSKIEMAYGASIEFVAQTVTTSPKIQAAAPFFQAFGDVFRYTEALTSFVFTKIFMLIFILFDKLFKIQIDKEQFEYVIIAVTMIILTYQFSVKRYYELLHIKQIKARESAELERKKAAASATTKKLGATAFGAGLGLLLTFGNPLGAALGGLFGSMFADSSSDAESVEEGKKQIVDQSLVVEATVKGILSSIIYTLLLLLLIMAPKIDSNYANLFSSNDLRERSNVYSEFRTLPTDTRSHFS